MSDEFDPYDHWLGIPPEEQPPHHYRLLGVRLFENDEQVIQNAADLRMTQLRSAQIGRRAALSQQLLNEVAAARACLLNSRRRGEYDAELKRCRGERPIDAPLAPPTAPSAMPDGDALAPAVEMEALPPLASNDPLQAPSSDGGPSFAAPLAAAKDAPAYAPGTYGYVPPYPAPPRRNVPLIAAAVGVLLALLVLVLAVPVVAVIAMSGAGTSDDGDATASLNARPTPRRTAPPSLRSRSIRRSPPSIGRVRQSVRSPIAAGSANIASSTRTGDLLDDALLIYDFEPDTRFNAGVVVDRSSHAFHGQVQGAPTPQRVNSAVDGAALEFQGGRGALRVPRLSDALARDLKQFTVAAWVLAEADQAQGMIFDVGWYASESITLIVKEPKLSFALSTKHGGTILDAPLGPVQRWHHVAAVWDGKEQRLYIDGRLSARQVISLQVLNSRSLLRRYPVTVGASAKGYGAADRYFRGKIDELVVLPRGLSDVEVAMLFNARASGDSPPVSAASPAPSPAPASTSTTTPPAGESPVAAGKTINLISLVDLARDGRPPDKWRLVGGELHCVRGVFRPKVVFPYEPPEEYDVKIVFSQAALRNAVSIIMPKRGASFAFSVGGRTSIAAFSVKPTISPNPTATRLTPAVQPSRRYTAVVQVRDDGVKAFVDGKLVSRHQTDFSDLATDSWRNIKQKKQIAVDTDDPTVFHQVELTEISGPGRHTRSN